MSLNKLIKQREDLQKQLNETSQRIYAPRKKNMNGYHWDDRVSCVEDLKKVDKQISKEANEMSRKRKYY